MVAFIDAHRDVDGVEPICAQLPIAPSTYYAAKAQARDPRLRSARAQHEATLRVEIQRVWDDEFPRLRGRQSVAPARARNDSGGALHGGAVDAGPGPPGRDARARLHDHDERGRGGAARRSRAAPLHGDPPERALGRRSHVRGDVARLRLRRLRHRRLRAADCRLARRHDLAIGSGARRARASAARASRSRWPRASQRSRRAIPRDPLHRAPGRRRHRSRRSGASGIPTTMPSPNP